VILGPRWSLCYVLHIIRALLNTHHQANPSPHPLPSRTLSLFLRVHSHFLIATLSRRTMWGPRDRGWNQADVGQCDWNSDRLGSPVVVSFVLTSGALANRSINCHLDAQALIDLLGHACWAQWTLTGWALVLFPLGWGDCQRRKMLGEERHLCPHVFRNGVIKPWACYPDRKLRFEEAQRLVCSSEVPLHGVWWTETAVLPHKDFKPVEIIE